jgi:hypothetical protein
MLMNSMRKSRKLITPLILNKWFKLIKRLDSLSSNPSFLKPRLWRVRIASGTNLTLNISMNTFIDMVRLCK